MKTGYECPNCGSTVTDKSRNYHKCMPGMSKAARTKAWVGDALHRVHVIQFLRAVGLDETSSHTVETSYLCAEHQSAYLEYIGEITDEQMQFNVHNRATLFEARYAVDKSFRDRYQRTVLTGTLGYVVTDIPACDYASQLAIKNPCPATVVGIDNPFFDLVRRAIAGEFEQLTFETFGFK